MIFEEDSVELSDKAISMMNENPRPGSSEAKKTEEEEKQKKEIEKLKKRDSEVKAHEMAHKSTGGQYAGDIIYEYRTGPDGKRYAVSGYVNFNLSVESSPEKTIAKADQIYRAAMAPSDPSAADANVAHEAQKLRAEAVKHEMNADTDKMRVAQNSETAQNKVGKITSPQQDSDKIPTTNDTAQPRIVGEREVMSVMSAGTDQKKASSPQQAKATSSGSPTEEIV
jgi:hypothetical protein